MNTERMIPSQFRNEVILLILQMSEPDLAAVNPLLADKTHNTQHPKTNRETYIL